MGTPALKMSQRAPLAIMETTIVSRPSRSVMGYVLVPYHRCRPSDNYACVRSSDFPRRESTHDHLHGGICPSCAVEFPLSERPADRFTIRPRGLLKEIKENPLVSRERVVDIIQGIRRRRSIESEANLIRIHLYSFMSSSKMANSAASLRIIGELTSGAFSQDVQIVTTSEYEERHIQLEFDPSLNIPINSTFVRLSQIILCVSRDGD